MRFGEIYAIRCGAGTYIGSALGYATRRWAEHLRLLRAGRHHCLKLQAAFDESGVTSFSFSVLFEGIAECDLRAIEYEQTIALAGINALPAAEVRKDKQRAVCLDIQSGIPYRKIASKYGISLGTVAAIKAKYRVAANAEET